jgi:hypothetical protein
MAGRQGAKSMHHTLMHLFFFILFLMNWVDWDIWKKRVSGEDRTDDLGR